MATAFDPMFRQGPSMGEGADFFLKLKKFAEDPATGPAEPMASSGAPFQDQVLELMLNMVQNEFKTMLAYKTYAQTLRGPEHFGVAKEFEEHAENELEHADFLLRRLSVLMGGPVPVPDIPAPEPLDACEDIIHTMIAMEQEGIKNWQNLLSMLGDNPTKYTVEEFLARELHHVDELFQLLPSETAQAQQPQPGGATSAAPAPPAAEQPEAPPATSQAGDGPQAGQPPGLKLSSVKTAARQRFTRDEKGNIVQIPSRYEGNPEDPGSFSSALDEAFKYACKTAGIKIPAPSHDSTKGSSEAKTPNGAQNLDVFDAGGKEASNTGLGKPPVVPMENEPTSDAKDPQEETKQAAAAPEHLRKAKERGEANAVARSTQMKGQRGELYGDLVGRLLGGAAGWKAGKTLAGKSGSTLARVMGVGMAQAAGGRVGKQIGREADAARAKKKFGAALIDSLPPFLKTALEDQMNMLAQEQAAEQAEMANAGRFYATRAQEHAQARQALEQQLQQVQSDLEQKETSIQQMQEAMAANSSAASESTTNAMLQAVNSNTQAIQQRQLASDAANANMTLRDQLRQLADGPSDGNPQGPGDVQGAVQGPSGGPTSGNGEKELQDGPGNAPPAGESNAYQPIQSPESGLAKGEPGRVVGVADDNRQPSTPSAYKDGGQGKQAGLQLPPDVKAKLRGMGLGAAAGAGVLGGATAFEAARGPGPVREKVEKLEAKPGSFRNSMQTAQAKGHLAFREAVAEHPVAATAASMLPGAALGASLGPAAVSAGKKVIQNIKALRAQ